MNITLIGPTYPYKGGISHFTTMLADSLRKQHTVNLLSWKQQYPAFLFPVKQEDTQSKNQVKAKAKFLLHFANPFTWIAAVYDIRKSGSQLLLITWVTPVQAPIYFVISALTKALTKTKIAFICHNVRPHEQMKVDTLLIKLAFSQADYFMVHSADEKIEALKLTSKPCTVGFHPSVEIFSQPVPSAVVKLKTRLKLKRKVLLFFGNIRPYKGLNYLIEAMPMIVQHDPDISLIVAGEFWKGDETYYRELVDKLKISDHVIFVNHYIPNEEVSSYFAVSDVVVLPYVSATQSAVIQVAYAFDKPVISTPVGGLKDVIEEGKTGYFVKPGNPVDIAEKILWFYQTGIKDMDIQSFIKKWSWDRYMQLLLKPTLSTYENTGNY